MREFIDDENYRVAPQRRVEIEFLARDIAITDRSVGSRSSPRSTARSHPAVRLDVANDDVGAGGSRGTRRFEHGVRLADAGSGAEKNAQPPALRPGLLGLHVCQQLIGIRPLLVID